MSRLSFASVAAVAAFALSPLPAHAQDLTRSDLRAGMRVRVSTAQLEGETATLLAYHGDTLLLLAGSRDTVPLALSSVSELDVSMGTRRNRRGGAMVGLGIGGLVGAGIGGLAVLADGDTGFSSFAAVSGMAGGALVGLVSGAIMGAGRTDDWRRVVDGRSEVAVRVAPRVDHTGVGLSVALPLGRW
ncbi:MAG TPA: hypothetical protein VGE02_07125 [Gemmatimonadales bacterium]